MLPHPIRFILDPLRFRNLNWDISVFTPHLEHCPNLLHFILVTPSLILGSLQEVNVPPPPIDFSVGLFLFPHFPFGGKMLNSSPPLPTFQYISQMILKNQKFQLCCQVSKGEQVASMPNDLEDRPPPPLCSINT